MDKEEILFQKRLQDLANSAYQKGNIVFTDFLTMNELAILSRMNKCFPGVKHQTFGGYEFAERQMAMFVSDAYFSVNDDDYHDLASTDSPYPIALLKITPVHEKFAEELSHRDYLGALLNLGVERCKIGDIIVREKEGYVYCHERMAPFFQQELKKVRHTFVQVEMTDEGVEKKSRFSEVKGTVASLRADSIVSVACGQSRTSVLQLFQDKKIYVNARLMESNSGVLNEGDVISVRGYGKFIFEKVGAVTKKNRYCVILKKFI